MKTRAQHLSKRHREVILYNNDIKEAFKELVYYVRNEHKDNNKSKAINVTINDELFKDLIKVFNNEYKNQIEFIVRETIELEVNVMYQYNYQEVKLIVSNVLPYNCVVSSYSQLYIFRNLKNEQP